MSLAAFALLAVDDALAQAAFPPPPPKVSPAAGVIDMHVHSHPDVFGRNMDDIDVAQLAKARGMRGIVLKNHISETASRAALAMKVVPGIEVFGGIVLNNAGRGASTQTRWNGCIASYGSRGKVVWLPTFESDKHVKTFSGPDSKGLTVAPNGKVSPEMEAILRIIARENLVPFQRGVAHRARPNPCAKAVASTVIAVMICPVAIPGSNFTPLPTACSWRAVASSVGVRSEHARHPWLHQCARSHMAQAKEVTDLGAQIEVCFLQFQAGPNAPLAFLTHWTQINAKHVAQATKELGAKISVVSSDLGQSANITHPDGIEVAVGCHEARGHRDADIDLMARKSPAMLLGHAAPGLHLSPLSDRAAQHGLGGSRIGEGRLPYEDS